MCLMFGFDLLQMNPFVEVVVTSHLKFEKGLHKYMLEKNMILLALNPSLNHTNLSLIRGIFQFQVNTIYLVKCFWS